MYKEMCVNLFILQKKFRSTQSSQKRHSSCSNIVCHKNIFKTVYQMRKTMKLSISVLKLSVIVFTSKRLFIHPCNIQPYCLPLRIFMPLSLHSLSLPSSPSASSPQTFTSRFRFLRTSCGVKLVSTILIYSRSLEMKSHLTFRKPKKQRNGSAKLE